jgi:hypothetical protein
LFKTVDLSCAQLLKYKEKLFDGFQKVKTASKKTLLNFNKTKRIIYRMLTKKVFCAIFSLAVFFTVFCSPAALTNAQTKKHAPELSVAGIELGNRESAKKLLSKYTPRIGYDGKATYWFYNKFGTQVMTLTAASKDDPFFITEIEVFAVDQNYKNKHFVANDFGFFVTESGIFIGYRQSAFSMIVGVPNAGREDRIGPKDVIRKKGQPRERVKEQKLERFTYHAANVPAADGNADYEARYQFYKNQLNRFSIKIVRPQISSKKAEIEK